MQFYVLVNSTGIEEVAATELPQIPEIQKLVGIPGEEAFFEAVYGCYSDQSLAVCVTMTSCGRVISQLWLLPEALFFRDKFSLWRSIDKLKISVC